MSILGSVEDMEATQKVSASVALEKIRPDHRQQVSVSYPEPGICVTRDSSRWPCDAARLLAALEAAMKLADTWEAKASEIGAQISYQDTKGAVAGFKMIGYQNHRDHAKALQEAVAIALTER
jgi:hypothetical protein